MKKKLEPKSIGPLKDDDSPWNGITLNRCLVVAAIAALLSMGFQVLQDAVDSDDDFTRMEAEVWNPLHQNEQLTEASFFEGWFGSSKAQLPEETETLNIEESTLVKEGEIKTHEVEQQVSTIQKKAKVKESQGDSLIKKPLKSVKLKDKKDKQKLNEQRGLKLKDRYMVGKAAKIRKEPNEGFKEREVLSFSKKRKESIKSYPEIKEKSSKEKSYQKKYGERKFDYHKKQEFGKSFRKDIGKHNKHYKQETL